MPAFKVTDPTTGRSLKLTGDSPPTEAELEEIFSRFQSSAKVPPQKQTQISTLVQQGKIPGQVLPQAQRKDSSQPGLLRRAGEEIRGGLETAAAVGSSAIAAPVSGLAGVLGLAEGSEQASQDVGDIREELTFRPRTETGKRNIRAVGKALAPVAEFFEKSEKTLGDAVFDATGSPALSAAATTIPTLATELAGIGLFKGAVKGGAKLKAVSEGKAITKAIAKAAPTKDQLFSTSSAIFKEIDDLGITVHPWALDKLTRKLQRIGKKGGLDKQITPDSAQALKRFEELQGVEIQLSELDILRKVTQGAASSIKRPDKALAVKMLDGIDEFLESTGTRGLRGSPKAVTNVGKRYKVARKLWGRARRSEEITDAISAAKETASGFENGIRIELRKIIKRNKKTKFFSRLEVTEMQKVVRGTKGANIAKLIGKLGFSEGQATSFLGGSIGVGAGATVGGPLGAAAVPIVGSLSKKLATKLTKGNAEFADQIVRAGKDAEKITKAYFKNTPKAERSVAGLNELLLGIGAR